jgi:hypothetical protein
LDPLLQKFHEIQSAAAVGALQVWRLSFRVEFFQQRILETPQRAEEGKVSLDDLSSFW